MRMKEIYIRIKNGEYLMKENKVNKIMFVRTSRGVIEIKFDKKDKTIELVLLNKKELFTKDGLNSRWLGYKRALYNLLYEMFEGDDNGENIN